MFVSHRQNAGQNDNLLISSNAFEEVAKLKHVGITVTHKKLHSRRN
jgi:hypothetical protein